MSIDVEAFVAEARAVQIGQAVNDARRRGAPRPVRVRPPVGRPPGARPDFRRSDTIVVNHSGGKDGLSALFEVVEQAEGQGILGELVRDGRLVVQYNRLGYRVSWPGTAAMGQHADRLVQLHGDRPGTEDLARAHAEHFGLRFEVTECDDMDLLDYISERGKFPSGAVRFCTSRYKRGPGRKLLTRLVRELNLSRPARVLYVFGFRAQESDARAKRTPFTYNAPASGAGMVRQVHDWYPVHHWTEDQVWSAIHASGVPYAWPYDAGLRRLSCRLCVLSGLDDLVLAAALSPDVADLYAAIEGANVAVGKADSDARGRTFQANRSMHQIIAAAQHVIV